MLNHDPTVERLKHLYNKIYSLQYRMVKWVKTRGLEKETYDRIFTAGAKPGVWYGLPKAHKDNLPIRPIFRQLVQ